jgi:hypothetical protein
MRGPDSATAPELTEVAGPGVLEHDPERRGTQDIAVATTVGRSDSVEIVAGQ